MTQLFETAFNLLSVFFFFFYFSHSENTLKTFEASFFCLVWILSSFLLWRCGANTGFIGYIIRIVKTLWSIYIVIRMCEQSKNGILHHLIKLWHLIIMKSRLSHNMFITINTNLYTNITFRF